MGQWGLELVNIISDVYGRLTIFDRSVTEQHLKFVALANYRGERLITFNNANMNPEFAQSAARLKAAWPQVENGLNHYLSPQFNTYSNKQSKMQVAMLVTACAELRSQHIMLRDIAYKHLNRSVSDGWANEAGVDLMQRLMNVALFEDAAAVYEKDKPDYLKTTKEIGLRERFFDAGYHCHSRMNNQNAAKDALQHNCEHSSTLERLQILLSTAAHCNDWACVFDVAQKLQASRPLFAYELPYYGVAAHRLRRENQYDDALGKLSKIDTKSGRKYYAKLKSVK